MATFLFVHDWAVPCRPLASTHGRYNTLTNESIQSELSLIRKAVQPKAVPPENNYFRSVKWSPDGSYLLTNSNDNVLRLFDSPASVYETSANPDMAVTELDMVPTLGLREGEAVYDFSWYPSMNVNDPATCCFLTSVNDHPVRLWDATTGKMRASYRVIDHQERFIGPNVVTFNLDGTRIYCGYENMIEIFDVQQPGSDSQKCATNRTRRSKRGQKGIISCLDFCPVSSGIYAAGSYAQTIGIYDEESNELCWKLSGIQGGVTQVKFSRDGNVLFAASRQSNKIECWDIRNSGNVLYQLERPGMTNQRIAFDIDPSGKVLMTGDTHGHLLFYDISTGETTANPSTDRLLRSVDAHQDIVSTATFHPFYPAIASTSGQRKFRVGESDDDSDDDGDNHESTNTEPSNVIDNSLKIWQVFGQWYQYSEEATATAEAGAAEATAATEAVEATTTTEAAEATTDTQPLGETPQAATITVSTTAATEITESNTKPREETKEVTSETAVVMDIV